MADIQLRPLQSGDEAFLFELYAELRAPEFAHVPLPEAQKEQLIRMQYAAQRNGYAAQYPGSDYRIVLSDDTPVGKLWVAPMATCLHLVDIALLPDARNRGIGTYLVRQLQRDAALANIPVQCSVFRFNPGSLRFHQRLGFTVTREDEIQFYLEWRSP